MPEMLEIARNARPNNISDKTAKSVESAEKKMKVDRGMDCWQIPTLLARYLTVSVCGRHTTGLSELEVKYLQQALAGSTISIPEFSGRDFVKSSVYLEIL